MPRPVQSLALRSFVGGLNLRADQFQLGPNETPAVLNMDMDPRGGVKLRKGVEHWWTADQGIHSIGAFYGVDGEAQVILGHGTVDDTVISWTNGTSSTDFADNPNLLPLQFAQFKDAAYIQNGVDKPIKWTGSVASRLNQSWSPDIAAPTTGNMPVGKSIVAHNGHIFVANTLEDEVRFPNRIRFSHINQPESFRQFDYFDVDPGVDGDEIVALVPFSDHLLVFKRRSTYLVYGFDAESFQVQNLSREVGATSPHAVAATPTGVFFFAAEAGVMFYDGRSLGWRFEKLIPALDTEKIPSAELETVTCGWLSNRLWVSVPWEGNERRVLVFDPSLGKDGAWTMYGLELDGFLVYEAVSGAPTPLATAADVVVELEINDQPWDWYGAVDEDDDPVFVHIESHWVSPWIDAGEVAVRKRWRRPWFVFLGETNDNIEVAVYSDYDGSNRRKTFYEQVAGSTEAPIWDDPAALWDGGGVWGGEGRLHSIERGSTLGLARSVQLRLKGPESNATWGLDNITFTYIPRRLR